MDIKPIETVYNDYRFRSRLEARWAVFHDELKLEQLYELQGFRLSDGSLYLPDFYLPHFNVYVEIKASRELDDGKAEKFAFSGSEDCPGVLICYGDPANHDMSFVTSWECDESGGGCYKSRYAMYEMHNADGRTVPHIHIPDRKTERRFFATKNIFADWYCPTKAFGSDAFIQHAEKKARQARFEHGETPHINN